jgi:D-3-phosphoglycerate dehydrogenase
MLSHERIRRLRPGVIVVNVSRGGLVDESALAKALIEGRLGGAGIDVFADEPLGLDSPLLGAPNTILTPHVAWRSEESRRDYQLKAIAQAELALSGEPMANVVNAGAYGVG